MTDQKKKEVMDEFDELTNMTASELGRWLKTKQSQSVGQDSGDGESIGHKSGEQIMEIKRKKRSELNDRDFEHMGKVVSYIKRHSAQRPKEIKGSKWAYSLKNWGCDPQKPNKSK